MLMSVSLLPQLLLRSLASQCKYSISRCIISVSVCLVKCLHLGVENSWDNAPTLNSSITGMLTSRS